MSAKSEPISSDETLPFALDPGGAVLKAPDATAWAGAILQPVERAGLGEPSRKNRPRPVRAIRFAGPALD
jgi:hypothetical protein